jgi:hypothetical protein
MIAQQWENIRFLVILSTNSFRSLSLKWIIREEMGKKGRGVKYSGLSVRVILGKRFNPHQK